MGLIQPLVHSTTPVTMPFAHQSHIFSSVTNADQEGSVIVELSTGHLAQKANQIISSKCGNAGGPEFQLSLISDENRIEIMSRNISNTIRFSLANVPFDKIAKFRITYSWSKKQNTSLLTVENLESGHLFQAEINDTASLSPLLLKNLLNSKGNTQISKAVSFIGVSDQVQPVGLAMAISPDATISTPVGQIAIQHLKIGDMVHTLDNGVQPIRWIGSQNVPALGAFCPVQMRAPYHQLQHNVFVNPKQRILVNNTNVEYLFGQDSVLVEAHHLLDHVSAIRRPKPGVSHQLFHILFDRHEIIKVSGCYMESLFIGGIANDPNILKTTLLRDVNPQTLPRHTQKVRPFLGPYEAAILQSEMQL